MAKRSLCSGCLHSSRDVGVVVLPCGGGSTASAGLRLRWPGTRGDRRKRKRRPWRVHWWSSLSAEWLGVVWRRRTTKRCGRTVVAELGGVRRCGHGSTMRSSGVSSWRPCGAGEEPIESRGGGRWEITSSSRPGNGGDGESWGCWRGKEVAGRGVGAAACTCDLVPVFIGR